MHAHVYMDIPGRLYTCVPPPPLPSPSPSPSPPSPATLCPASILPPNSGLTACHPHPSSSRPTPTPPRVDRLPTPPPAPNAHRAPQTGATACHPHPSSSRPTPTPQRFDRLPSPPHSPFSILAPNSGSTAYHPHPSLYSHPTAVRPLAILPLLHPATQQRFDRLPSPPFPLLPPPPAQRFIPPCSGSTACERVSGWSAHKVHMKGRMHMYHNWLLFPQRGATASPSGRRCSEVVQRVWGGVGEGLGITGRERSGATAMGLGKRGSGKSKKGGDIRRKRFDRCGAEQRRGGIRGGM